MLLPAIYCPALKIKELKVSSIEKDVKTTESIEIWKRVCIFLEVIVVVNNYSNMLNFIF